MNRDAISTWWDSTQKHHLHGHQHGQVVTTAPCLARVGHMSPNVSVNYDLPWRSTFKGTLWLEALHTQIAVDWCMPTHPQLAYAPLLPTFTENSKTIWQLRGLLHGIRTQTSWRLLATNLNLLWPLSYYHQLRSPPIWDVKFGWTMYNLRNFRQDSSLTIYVESV